MLKSLKEDLREDLLVDPRVSRRTRPFDFVIASIASFLFCVLTFYAIIVFAVVKSRSVPDLSELTESLAEIESRLWLDFVACVAAPPIAWLCSRIGVFTFNASMAIGCLIGLTVYFAYFGTGYSGVFPPPPMIAAIYGVSASTIFFVTLSLRRPTAFHERWHDRGLQGLLLLCAIPPMLFGNWMRVVGLNISVAP